jgi:hypothetical protein
MASGGALNFDLQLTQNVILNLDKILSRISPEILDSVMGFLPTMADTSNFQIFRVHRMLPHCTAYPSHSRGRGPEMTIPLCGRSGRTGLLAYSTGEIYTISSRAQQEGGIYLPDCPAWQNRLRVWENAIHAAKTCWKAELNLRKTRNLDSDMSYLSGCTIMADIIGRYDPDMDTSGDDELECLQGLEKYIRTIGSNATNDQLVYQKDFQQ